GPGAAASLARPGSSAGACALVSGLCGGLLDLLEPRAARLERGLRLVDLARVAVRLGFGELGLEPRDRVLELRCGAFGAGLRLGVRAPPLGLLGVPDRLLDRTHAALDALDVAARDLARGVPAVLEDPQRGLRGSEVLDRHELLGLGEDLLLDLEVRAVLLVDRGVRRVAGREEVVLRGAEAGPQRVVVLAARTPRGLPARHQVAVGARRGAPVGRALELLGLRDDLLLEALRLGVARLELGEEVPAVAVEGRARGREPLPQRVLDLAVDPRAGLLGGLPAVEQGAQRLPGLLPLGLLGVARGDRLGLLDDRGARDDGFLLRGRAGGLDRGAALGGDLAQPLEPGTQPREVTDGRGLGGLLGELLERLVDLLDRQVGRAEPRLEKADLGVEVEEAAHVEAQ